MISKNDLIYNYRQTLLGIQNCVSNSLFPKGEEYSMQAERNAKTILQYTVEKLLCWSPQEMQYKFNRKIIEQFKLMKIMQFIPYPPEVNPHVDYFYYASYLYPDIIKIDFKKLTILMYKKVMVKQIPKLPKLFFDGNAGRIKATTCLNYVITNVMATESKFLSIDDLYEFFADERRANSFLNEHRLLLAKHLCFSSSLEYLHESLPEQNRSEVLYHYYQLLNALQENATK